MSDINRNILYLNNLDVTLLQRSSKNNNIILHSKLTELNYDTLKLEISKIKNLTFVVNSLNETSENKNFVTSDKRTISTFLSTKQNEKDVVYQNYNTIFKNKFSYAEGIITTAISKFSPYQDKDHLTRITNLLIASKCNIDSVYSFNQLILNLFKVDSNLINVNVFISKNITVIIVSLGACFILGRTISMTNINENDILLHTLKSISITIKYIGTAFGFIKSNTIVNIVNQGISNVDIITKSNDPVLHSLTFNVTPLTSSKSNNNVNDELLNTAILLIEESLSHGKLSRIKTLNNKKLSYRNFLFNTINIFKIILKFLIVSLIISVIIEFALVFRLGEKNRHYSLLLEKQIMINKKQRTEIAAQKDNMYYAINDNIANYLNNPKELYEISSSISKFVNKFRNNMVVIQYGHQCLNCAMPNKTYSITMRIQFNNPSGYIDDVIKLKDIMIAEVANICKKYKQYDFNLSNLPKATSVKPEFYSVPATITINIKP